MAESEAQRHQRIADRFTRCVTGVSDWQAPTPVAAWRARDIVDHLVTWFPAFLAAGDVNLPPGPSTAYDPNAAWTHHSAAVQRLLDDADANRDFTHPHLGTMPLAVAIDRFYTTDVFLHTWDLARATGQDDRLDDNECASLLRGMQPADQLLRDSGQYGPKVDVPAHASVQDQLIGFIGRDPNWQP